MATGSRERRVAQAIAAELRAVIARRQIQHRVLSEGSGIPKSTLSNLLSGHSAMDVDQLARICAVIGVEPADVMSVAVGHVTARPTDAYALLVWLIDNPESDEVLASRLSEVEERTGLNG